MYGHLTQQALELARFDIPVLHLVGAEEFAGGPLAAILSSPLPVAGAPGAGIAVAVGVWLLLAYEFAHGFSHLVAEPASSYGRMLRKSHMLHHFHNEKGNFGVTSPVFDLVFGTYYGSPTAMERCPTVRNLGYPEEEARRFPFVANIEDARTRH